MNFLLINPTRGYDAIQPKKKKLEFPRFTPLGLLYVASSLLDEGHKVEVLELYAERDPMLQLKKSLKAKDSVGIGITSYSYNEAILVAKKIKEKDSSIPVIIGGPHCTFHPRQSLIDVPDTDISVAGDGEQAIKDVAQALNGNKKLSDIAGIHYKHGRKIKQGKPAEPIINLDTISFPARHLVDKYRYGMINDSYLFRPDVTSTATSRGCPFSCRFSSRADHLKKFRQRSAENVVEEIIDINEKYGTVIITDENFLTNTKRAHKIFNKLIEQSSTIDLVIEGSRVDTAERELYKKMKKAGVKFIAFGLESGNQSVLDFYNKKITLEQVRKAVELASEMNIITHGNFILGAPIETKEHIEKTIRFACSLPLDVAVFCPLWICYGSDLWKEAVDQGKIEESEHAVYADSGIGIGNFKAEELEEYSFKAFKRFYLRPQYFIGGLFRMLRRNDFRLLKVGFNYL